MPSAEINTDNSLETNSNNTQSSKITSFIAFDEIVLLTALMYLPHHLLFGIIALSGLTWKDQKEFNKAQLRQLVTLCGYQKSKIADTINQLIALNVIIQYGTVKTGKQKNTKILGINRDISTWNLDCEPQVLDPQFYEAQQDPENLQKIKKQGFLFPCFFKLPQKLIWAANIMLGPLELALLLAIGTRTWGGKKDLGRISTAQLAKAVGEKNILRVKNTLNKLIENNVIIETKKGRSIYLEINFDYLDWKIEKGREKVLGNSYLNYKNEEEDNSQNTKNSSGKINQIIRIPQEILRNTPNLSEVLTQIVAQLLPDNIVIDIVSDDEINSDGSLKNTLINTKYTILSPSGSLKNPDGDRSQLERKEEEKNRDEKITDLNYQTEQFKENYESSKISMTVNGDQKKEEQDVKNITQSTQNEQVTKTQETLEIQNPQAEQKRIQDPGPVKKETNLPQPTQNNTQEISKAQPTQDEQVTKTQEALELQKQQAEQLAKIQKKADLRKQQDEREKLEAKENQIWIDQVQALWNQSVDDSKNVYNFKGLVKSKSPKDKVKAAILKLRTEFNLEQIEGIFGQMASSFWLCGMSSKFQAWICWGTDFDNCLEYYDRWQNSLKTKAKTKETEARKLEEQKKNRLRRLEEKQRQKAAAEKRKAEQRELEEKRKSYPKISEWSQILEALEATIHPDNYSQIKDFVVGTEWLEDGQTLLCYVPDGFTQVLFEDKLADYVLQYTSAQVLEYYVEGGDLESTKRALEKKREEERKEKELRANYPQIPEWDEILTGATPFILKNYHSHKEREFHSNNIMFSVIGAEWIGTDKTLLLFMRDDSAKDYFEKNYADFLVHHSKIKKLEYFVVGEEPESAKRFLKKRKEEKEEAEAEAERAQAKAREVENKYRHFVFWQMLVYSLESKIPKADYENFKNGVIGSCLTSDKTTIKLILKEKSLISFFTDHYEQIIREDLSISKIEYHVDDG